MEKKITKKEESRANQIKVEFFEVHSQIGQIQKEMDLMNQKAESLIEKLGSLRKEEVKFMESLKEKYGEGTLVPFTLTYKINEKNEISS